jgi:hypothetical protein
MKTLARPPDLAEILRRLKAVHPGSARRWGRMSAHQMVCHLNDSCLMALGGRPVRPRGGIVQRTIVKWIALYLPLRWPVGIRTTPEVDQEAGGTRPADFAEDVAQLEVLLGLIAKSPATLDGRVHPIFGRMTRSAWLRWAYLHAEHHLRQFGA